MSFSFCLPSHCGSTLKGKYLLLYKQILFLKHRSLSERIFSSMKAKKKWQMLFPFVNMPEKPGPEVIKRISCSTQLSMKFLNVKMPTTVVYEQEKQHFGITEPGKC